MDYAVPNRQTNLLAVISLVLGILGVLSCWCAVAGIPLGVAGLVTGLVANNQIRARGDQGRGLAIAGIVLSAVCIAFACLFLGGEALSGFSGGFRGLRVRPLRSI